VNTVGWSPCHAAAAGGHTKVLRLLAKHDADFTLTDNGGNTAAHQAAKNGHVHVLRVIRLSHAKGRATRDYIIEAYRKAGKKNVDDEADDEQAPVGYARKQAKSNAFFGPRRTPISTKIKKRIIKEKRLKNKEKADIKCMEEEVIQPQYYRTTSTSDTECNEKEELSYIETVRQVKRNKKLRRKQKQGRTQQKPTPEAEEQQDNITSEDDEEEDNLSIDVGEDEEVSVTANGFAALLLLDDSDSE